MDYKKIVLLVMLNCISLLSFSQSAVELYNKGVEYHNRKDFKQAFQWFKKAADKGDESACLTVANYYTAGTGIEQDLKQAEIYYKKCPDDAFAQSQLAHFYYYGNGGISVNYPLAFNLSKKAAEKGELSAKYLLGICYHYGKGVPQDYSKAFEWFLKSAEQGHKEGLYSTALCYYNGEGAPQDYSKAFEWFLKSAEQGHKEGLYSTALCYYNGEGAPQDYSKAFEWFLKSAEQGHKEGLYFTALCYYNGKGIPQDYSKAFEWFLKSAEQGHKEGLYFTALCYYNGEGAPQDYSKAFEWFLKSAEQGHKEGLYFTALCYYNGKGIPQDYSKAFEWFLKSAEQGHKEGLYSTALCHFDGKGVLQDYSKATEYLRKAADGGNESAKLLLEDILYPVPTMNKGNENTFAIIIGNYECQNFPAMYIDLSIFKEYIQKTLGLKDKQIKILKNPSLGDMIVAFDWIKNVTEAYNGESKVIVYYTGPGISDESTGEAFILPNDADALDPLSGYSVNELCETFGNMSAKSIVVILDACFNGTKNDGTMIASSRGVAIKSKPATPRGNMVLMTASSNDETAYAVDDYYRGVFTTKFLQKVKETKGEATLGEIFDFASKEVSKNIILEKGKPQTPQVIVSPQLGDSWRKWKLNE